MDHFVQLVSGVNAKLKEKNRWLTSTYIVENDLEEYNFAELSKYYDHITYIYGYPIIHTVKDALKVRNISHIEEQIESLTAMDIPPAKIIIGLPFESPQFLTTLINGESNFEGPINYNAMCRVWSSETKYKWLRTFNEETGLAIAQSQKFHTGNVYSIVYDSSRSIANKIRYAMKKGLGGVTTGLLHADDFHGHCELDADTYLDFKPIDGVILNIPQRNSSMFALVRTISEAIEVTLDEVAQEIKLRSNSPRHIGGVTILIGSILAFLVL